MKKFILILICLLFNDQAFGSELLDSAKGSKLLHIKEDIKMSGFESMGECETNIWKAYYDKRMPDAASNLKIWIEQVYGIPDATEVLPAFIDVMRRFSGVPLDSPEQTYNETILPALITVFEKIRKTSCYDFDPSKLAGKELEWWVSRRSPAKCNPENVGKIMAEAYALVYGGTAEDYAHLTYLRARAARYRDLCQDKFKKLDEEAWGKVRDDLTDSYKELQSVLMAREERSI